MDKEEHEKIIKEYFEAQDRLIKNHPEFGDPFWWDHGDGKKVEVPDYLREVVERNAKKAAEKN